MADGNKDQFSSTIGIRVKSPLYLMHLRAIFALLGVRNVHGVRKVIDLGIRQLIKDDGRKEDAPIYEQHLKVMDKS